MVPGRGLLTLPEVNPPSDTVPGSGLLTLPILEALRRWNDGEIRDSVSYGRVHSRRSKYRPKEGVRRGGVHPGGLWARPGARPRRRSPGQALDPLWPIFGDLEASVM
ncbi:hypothetical protein D1007_08236 [Hordeum vulgare]|nr:hypothetical protein D1007_08236 [Hordeum vulgare]